MGVPRTKTTSNVIVAAMTNPKEKKLRVLPNRISEEEMGDVFEEDPFGGLLGGEGGEKEPAEGKKTLGRLRRMLPPAHDPELYEMS